ncbi:hypothetical protein EAI30_17080, partial [Romboutsia ilealis]|nr:hypothetical protein [Romboutsia ilealis]
QHGEDHQCHETGFRSETEAGNEPVRLYPETPGGGKAALRAGPAYRGGGAGSVPGTKGRGNAVHPAHQQQRAVRELQYLHHEGGGADRRGRKRQLLFRGPWDKGKRVLHPGRPGDAGDGAGADG